MTTRFVKHLEWDSDIFGFKIGRLKNIKAGGNEKKAGALIKRIIEDCRKEHYRHITCRVGVSDFTLLRALEKNGFNIADVQITLSTGDKPKKRDVPGRGLIVAKASEKDLGMLKVLTRDAFTDTRIVRDPNYPRDKVDKFYYEWVKNSVYNKRQIVFLAKEKGASAPVGFVICGISDGIGFIDLISVRRSARGRGAGSVLAGTAMNWFSENSRGAEVRTQVSNIAAIRTFMRCGFTQFTEGRALSAGISLHYWF